MGPTFATTADLPGGRLKRSPHMISLTFDVLLQFVRPPIAVGDAKSSEIPNTSAIRPHPWVFWGLRREAFALKLLTMILFARVVARRRAYSETRVNVIDTTAVIEEDGRTSVATLDAAVHIVPLIDLPTWLMWNIDRGDMRYIHLSKHGEIFKRAIQYSSLILI